MNKYNEYRIVSVYEYTEDCAESEVMATVNSLEEVEKFLNDYAKKLGEDKVSRYLNRSDIQGELYFRVESHWGDYLYSFL